MGNMHMMKKCPAFHCDKGDTNAVDAMAKVKVLEEFLKKLHEEAK